MWDVVSILVVLLTILRLQLSVNGCNSHETTYAVDFVYSQSIPENVEIGHESGGSDPTIGEGNYLEIRTTRTDTGSWAAVLPQLQAAGTEALQAGARPPGWAARFCLGMWRVACQ